MNLSKPLFLGISLALLLGSSAYAGTGTLNSTEKNALATIAAIDKNEILVSIIAQNKKVDSNVLDFAKMMVEQHGSNLAQVFDIANQLKTGTLTSTEATKITDQGRQDLSKLGGLSDTDFTTAYVNAMVTGHEAALKFIDTQLKTAKTEEMKTFLTNTRTAVEDHLKHAKQLQQDLKG